MRRIGFSFARGLERRPWRGELAQAISLARRIDASASFRRRARCRRVEYNLAPDATGETPAGGITRLRHGVPGSIWVGANPPLASDRFGGRHAKGVTSVRAAPGPIPPGWPRPSARKERSHPRSNAASLGDQARGTRGSDGSRSCSQVAVGLQKSTSDVWPSPA